MNRPHVTTHLFSAAVLLLLLVTSARAQDAARPVVAGTDSIASMTLVKSDDGKAVVRFGESPLHLLSVGDRVGKTAATVVTAAPGRLVLEEVTAAPDGKPLRAEIVLRDGQTGGKRFTRHPDSECPGRTQARDRRAEGAGPQMISSGARPLRLLVALLALGPGVAAAQSQHVRTLEDRDHVTVMEFGGVYDRQPEANQAYEQQVRQVIAREFLRTHTDDYDFIVVFTRFGYSLGTDSEGAQVGGRYYGVKNDVEGIGLAPFDASAEFGSASGRLQGFIDMGVLSRLGTDPTDPRFEQTLSVLAHEFMHRWGSHVRFRAADGSLSPALLGRDGSHWNFLLNTHNSVHYGHEWRDNGDGTFTSVGRAMTFYSPLDLYLMGMLDRSQVPPFFLIENPSVPPGRLPEVGTTITGTRREVTIEDVVAAEGERLPSAAAAPKRFKMGFVFLVRPGEQAEGLELSAINTIRDAFSTRALILTGGKGVVQVYPEEPAAPGGPTTTLLPPSSGPRSAPVDLVQALDWVLARQAVDGSFADSAATRVRDTAAALDLLREVPAAFTSHQRGLAWLSQLQEHLNVDMVSRRLLAISPQYSATDAAFLADARNGAGGWGLRRGYRSDALDTALALLASPVVPAPADIAFIVNGQNPDGGWAVRPGSPSSVQGTLAVLRLKGRLADATLAAALQRGEEWLASRQRPDGGFGEEGSTVYETADAVLYLLHTTFPKAQIALALDWLRSRQLADGSWNESTYQTALALRALKVGELPNASVSSAGITFSLASPIDGQAVTVRALVVNDGVQDVTNLRVGVFDGDPAAGGTPIGGDIVIAHLPALAQLPVTVTWDTTGRAGPHRVFVVVDRAGEIDEFNEADNIASADITVRQPPVEPDLSIEQAALVLMPGLLQALPQDQTLTATIANAGLTTATNVGVTVFEGDPALGQQVGETAVTVPGRGQAQVTVPFRVTTPGEHRYFVVADALGQVAEADETNNVAFTTLLVQSTHDFLVVPGTLTVSENPTAPGRDLTVSAQVRNQGTTDAFSVVVRFSIDDPGGAIDLASRAVDLPAGGTATVSAVWRTSRALNASPLVVDIDPANAFPESSETNNRTAIPLTVSSSSLANLHVAPASVQVTMPVNEGAQATVSLPVLNNGAADAANVTVAFFVGLPANGGIQIGATQTIPILQAGAQAIASVVWTPIERGDKLIFAVVDAGGVVAEFDEADNSAFITVPVRSRPDFAISSAAISFAPAFPRQGDPVVATAIVTNMGEQAAPARVRFFDGDPARGGVALGPDQVIPSLAGQSTAAVQAAFDGGAAAVRAIYVLVDPLNEVVEQDEGNNTAFRTLGVQDGSLFASNLYFSPNGDDRQDSTVLFYRFEAPQAVGSVAIVNRQHKLVRTLELPDGTTVSGSATWDGRDDQGRVVADGPYDMTIASPSGVPLGSARVVVDTNNLPVGDAVGTRFLLDNNLTCGLPLESGDGYVIGYSTAGWLPDDTGLVKAFATAAVLRGGRIQYSDQAVGVYVIAPDGETTTRITPDSWTVHPPAGDGTRLVKVLLSPDGGKVLVAVQKYRHAFNHEDFYGPVELWVVNTDGSGLRKVGETPADAFIDAPYYYHFQTYWAPGGDRLAFTVSVGSFFGIVEARIYLANADGSGQALVQTIDERASSLQGVAWSRDADRLLYSVLEQQPAIGGYISNLYTILPDGTGRRTLAASRVDFSDLSSLVWLSADRFAFQTSGQLTPAGYFDYGNSAQLYLLTLDGAAPQLISRGGGNVRNVVPSPQGGQIAFVEYVSSGGGGPQRVWVAGADGEARELYRTGDATAGLEQLGWSGDGRRLAWVEELVVEPRTCSNSESGEYPCPVTLFGVGSILLAEGTATVHPVTAAGEYVNAIGLFPDGASFLFQDGDSRLMAISLADGTRTVILTDRYANVGEALFSPSGKYLLYMSSRDALDPARPCYKGVDYATDEFALSSVLNLTAQFGFKRDRSLLSVRGTAEDANFAGYRLEYARVSDASAWLPIGAASETSVVNDLLGAWVPPSDGAYYVRLTAEDKAGNSVAKRQRITWGLTPSITNVAVAPRTFSPNGDGTRDTVTIDYLVLGPVNLAFEIYDAADTLVRRIAQSHTTLGAASVAWDGRGDGGQFVPDGAYRIHVLDFDFFVTVDTTVPATALTLGTGFHTVPQKVVCLAPSSGTGCRVIPGPLVETPFFELTGTAVDQQLLQWRLEVGGGSNPSAWQFVAEGSSNHAAGTPFARLTALEDVVNRRYRLTAIDQAGNRSVSVSELAPQELILHAYDGDLVPTAIAVEQRLGPHTLALAYTGRTPAQWLTVQYRLQGTATWVSGPATPPPAPGAGLPWDNSTLASGRVYEVRVVSTDANGAQLTSNAILIRSNVFLLLEYLEDIQAVRGVISLNDTIQSLTLVTDPDGQDLTGASTFHGGPEFLVQVTRDPALASCSSRRRVVRFRAVGATGRVYYSNSGEVTQNPPPSMVLCPGKFGGGGGQFNLQIDTIEAAACGLPAPGQVRITVLSDGSATGAKLFVQQVPNGPLVEMPGLTALVDTNAMPEGVYNVRATAGVAADGQPAAVRTGTFVVDRQPPAARITYPATNQAFCGVQAGARILVPVEGIAEDPNFKRYAVEYGFGDNPQSWLAAPVETALGAGTTPRRGVLVNWDVTALQSGTYSLRERVYDRGGSLSCSTVSFFLPGPFTVMNPRADVRLISPNGDGVADSTTISYGLKDPATVSVRVYAVQNGQRAAVPVRTLFVNTVQLAGANSVVWNGLGDGGVAPPDGTYAVVISGADTCGNTAEAAVSIVLDNTRPDALIAAPLAGAPVGLVTDVRGTVADAHFQSYLLEVGESEAPATWTLVASGLAPVQDAPLGTWTRTGTAGTFTLRLTATDAAGNVRETRLALTVAETAGLVSVLTAAPAVFSPNLDGRRDTTVVAYEALADLRIRLDVLDGADTVVKVLTESDALATSRYSFGWDGRNEAGVLVPDGTYVVRLTAAARADATRTQVERTAVVVDTTPPVVTAAFPADAAFVRGDLAVTGSASDLHLDSYGVSYAVQPGGAATVLDQGRQSRTDYRFGALAGLADGLYSLTLTAEDGAQNISSRTIAFTVDNVAPEVALTAPASGAFAGGPVPAVEIRGTVRDAHLLDWTLRIGAGTDPQAWTALATGTAAPAPGATLASWNVAALPDGPYTISLVASDRAGATAEARASVIVDNTAPTALIREPLDGARIGAAVAIRGDALDANFKDAVLEFAPGHGTSAVRFEPLIQLTQPVADGVLFPWQALPPDGAYTLRLRVADQLGRTAESRVQVTLDTEPPQAPRALSAVVEARRNARLTWLASPDADVAGYNVYRDGTRLTPSPIAALGYLDENLPEGPYRYVVRAVDAGSLESEPSEPASLQINLTGPATRITSPVAGAVVSGLVEIRGTAASPDDFKEYRLLVGTGATPSTFTLVRRSPAPVTAGLLAELDSAGRPEGSVMTLRLEAEDIEGNVAADQVIVSIDNIAPAPPVLASAVPNGSDVTVQWQANPEADLAGYLLYDNHLLANVRRIVNGSTTPYLLPGTSFLDRALPDGDHEYYLFAVDRAGNISATSNVLTVTLETRAPRATITQPANSSATEHAITVVATTPDQDVAQVQFQLRADAAGAWTDLGAPDGAAPYQAAWDPQGLPFGIYHFRAVATDTRGNTDAAPPSIAITVRDLTPPAAPATLAAVVNGDTAALTWPAVSETDLEGYAVYRRSGTEPAVRINGALVTATTFTDAGLADAAYQYTVRAIDSSANESGPSPEAAAAIYAPALTAPAVCLAGETTAIAGTGAAPLSSVALFVATGGDPAFVASTIADAAGVFSFTAVAIAPGVNIFTARATDGAGNVSRLSADLRITQSARPGAPANFTAVVNGTDVALSWSASAGIDLYALTRNGEALDPIEEIARTGDATASSRATFNERATNGVDGDPFSVWTPSSSDAAPWWALSFSLPEHLTAVGITWGDIGAPADARDFDLEAWDGSSWLTLAQVRGSTTRQSTIVLDVPVLASAVRINRPVSSGGTVQLAEVQVFRRELLGGTTFDDPGLTDGRYTYVLTAFNACGLEGTPAQVEAAVGDVTPPAAPPGLTASVAGSSVTLGWNAVADADTAGYNVYRNSGSAWTKVNQAPVPSPGFVEVHVRNGTHLYRVVAIDATANESAPSNEATAIVDVPPPSPATLLVVTAPAEGGVLELGWQAAPGAVGYRILRATTAGGPRLALNAAAVPAAGYRDTAVVNGTRYFYVVQALDAAGNESAESNEADGVAADRLPPAAPVLLFPTDAARPRAMTAGITTIGGLAEPGATVTLLSDGYPLGQSAASKVVTSDVLAVPGANGLQAFLASDSLLATFAQPPGAGASALTLVDAASGATTTFAAAVNGYSPSFAPDGRTLVYVEDNGTTIALFTRATGHVSATFARPHFVTTPRVSPDGSSIVYVGGSYPRYELWVLDVTTGAARALVTDAEYPFEPAWSPAGDTVAFGDYRFSTSLAELKLANVASGAVSVVDSNILPEASSFAPDGGRLAFTSLRNGRSEVWIHDVASGTAAPLLDDGAERTGPAFGLDGSLIGYLRPEPAGTQAIHVFEFATGADAVFFRNAPNGPLLWTADRGMLIPDTAEVRRLRPAGAFSFQDTVLPFERNVFSAVAADTAGNQGAPAEPITLLRERRSLPDLAISDASIVAYPRFPVQGEPVRLSATVLNEGDVPATDATVGFYRQLPSGRLVLLAERTIAAIASSQQAVVSFDWQTTGLSGGQAIVVIADVAGAIPEFSEMNNEGRAQVVITVDGSPAVTVATDRSLYPASATVTVDAEVANPGGASDFVLELRIEDDGGFLVSSLLTEPLPAFGYDSRRVRATWPAAGVFAGGYHARAVLRRADAGELSATAPFAVTGDRVAQAAVTTDRAQYQVGDVVQVSPRATNPSQTVDLGPLRIITRIVDASGAEVMSAERDVPVLLTGASAQLPVQWAAGQAGSYTVQVTVSQDGQALAAADMVFSVSGVSRLQGRVTVTPAPVALRSSLLLSAEVSNAGSLALSGAPLRLVVLDVERQAVVREFTRVVDLVPGVPVPWQVSAESTGLELKTYSVLLQLGDAGTLRTLASSTVSIVDREAPVVSVISPAPGLLTNTAVQVSASATDDASGVARLDVRFDGGEWQAMTLSDAAAGRFTALFPATQAGEGPHTFNVRAVDRAGNSDTTSTEDANPAAGTFVIDVTPPAIAIAGVAAGQVYQAAVRPVIAVTDASPLTTTALLNGAPFISGTEVSAAGPYTLAVSSTDAAGNAASAIVSFTIQAGGTPPVASSQSVTTPEDTPAAIVLTAVDADDDALTFAVTVPPSHGTLSGTAPAVTYTPAPDFHGADQFTFTASDGTGVSAPAIVTIQVTPVNDLPVARVTAPASVSEGAAVVLNGAASADVDGDPLTYRWTQAGGPAAVLDLTNPAMPAFLAPEVGPPGATVIFDLVVRDGTVDSAAARVSVQVTNVNRAPTVDGQAVSLDEDTPVAIVLGASDGDGDALTFVVTAPAHGTLSGVAPNLTYTPAPDYNGADRFSFTASDATATSANATVTIEVAPVNDAPSAHAGADQSVLERTAVVLDGTGSADVDGDALTYRWTLVDGPPAVLNIADPARPAFDAPDVPRSGASMVFELVVNDGLLDSPPARVTVAVGNVNRAPQAGDQSLTTLAGIPVSWTLEAADPDNDPLSFAIVPPVNGVVTGTAPDLTYTPAPGFAGPDRLTVTVRDPDGLEATATVEITVGAVNRPPLASAGADQSVNEGSTVMLDGSGSIDPDGDPLTFAWSQVAGPAVTLDRPRERAPDVHRPGGCRGGRHADVPARRCRRAGQQRAGARQRHDQERESCPGRPCRGGAARRRQCGRDPQRLTQL